MMVTDGLNDKLIAAIVAGVLLFAFAWVLRGIDRNKSFKDKKIEHALPTVIHLSQYIESWRRLIAIASLQTNRKLTEDENDRMCRYVTQRDEAKISLISKINTLPLFFNKKLVDEFYAVKEWDANLSTKRRNKLPIIDEWVNWLFRLSEVLHNHIK
jgi:hypothetical protein